MPRTSRPHCQLRTLKQAPALHRAPPSSDGLPASTAGAAADTSHGDPASRPHTWQMSHALHSFGFSRPSLKKRPCFLLTLYCLSAFVILLQVLLNSCRLQRPNNLAHASSTTPTNLLITTNQPFGPPAPEGRRALVRTRPIRERYLSMLLAATLPSPDGVSAIGSTIL